MRFLHVVLYIGVNRDTCIYSLMLGEKRLLVIIFKCVRARAWTVCSDFAHVLHLLQCIDAVVNLYIRPLAGDS